MSNSEALVDNFEIILCAKCGVQKIDIIDINEYNEVLIFKCIECGEEFTRPVENVISVVFK